MEIHLISSINNIAQMDNKTDSFFEKASRYMRDIIELDTDKAADAAFYLAKLKQILDQRP